MIRSARSTLFAAMTLFYLVACSSTSEPRKAPPTEANPDAILSAIEIRGPSSILSEFWEADSRWDLITDGIRSGEAPWVAVYEKLRPVSDAGATLDLDQAIVIAIEKNPEPALSAVQNSDTSAQIDCGTTDEFTDEVEPSKSQAKSALKHLDTRRSAIQGVRASSVSPAVKSKCLKDIEKSQAYWSKALGPSPKKRRSRR